MQKIENFSYVEMSCRLAFISLTELSYLNKERSADQLKIMNIPPFLYYRISMQYMFLMEFTKLLEADTKDKTYRNGSTWKDYENKNFSSLAKLSRRVSDSLGTSFSESMKKIKRFLKTLRRLNFIKTQRGKEIRNLLIPIETNKTL